MYCIYNILINNLKHFTFVIYLGNIKRVKYSLNIPIKCNTSREFNANDKKLNSVG